MSNLENKRTDKDLERLNEMLDKVFRCPVCGGSKHHTRLNGYVCHNPRCAEIEREMQADDLRKEFERDSKRGLLALYSGKHSTGAHLPDEENTFED